MRAVLDDVKRFRAAAELPNPHGVVFAPEDRRQNALNLIREEFRELVVAHLTRDQVEAADAMADLIYVVCFAAAEEGIPLDLVWAEVQRSNMAKADPVTGKFGRNATGKIVKPAGWIPPDIESIIAQARGVPDPNLDPDDEGELLTSEITFGFSEALYLLEAGFKVTRRGWPATGVLVQQQTADAKPFFSMFAPGYSWHPSWIPYQEDLRAKDWHLVGPCDD